MAVAANWKTIAGKECLYFEFKSNFAEADAIVAVEQWKAAFRSKPGQKIPVVWNALEMKGYDTGSRLLWQKTLSELQPQIDGIWLITRSILITIGAGAISIFTKYEIKVVSAENEITFEQG